jgi:hypothetical protein
MMQLIDLCIGHCRDFMDSLVSTTQALLKGSAQPKSRSMKQIADAGHLLLFCMAMTGSPEAIKAYLSAGGCADDVGPHKLLQSAPLIFAAMDSKS